MDYQKCRAETRFWVSDVDWMFFIHIKIISVRTTEFLSAHTYIVIHSQKEPLTEASISDPHVNWPNKTGMNLQSQNHL